MGKKQAGKRDGTGPRGGGIGRRKAAGIVCPIKNKKPTKKSK